MSDETSEETPTTEVNVEVTPAEDTPEPEGNDTTVVVAGGSDNGIHPAVAEFMASQAAVNERILARLDTTEVVAGDAALTAEVAAGTVDSAVEEVQAVGEQVSATIAEHAEPSTPDNDIEPKHSEHRWYRKRGHGA